VIFVANWNLGTFSWTAVQLCSVDPSLAAVVCLQRFECCDCSLGYTAEVDALLLQKTHIKLPSHAASTVSGSV